MVFRLKDRAQRVREAEAAHRARGEREIRVWVPDNDVDKEKVRRLAAELCAQALERKSNQQ